MSKQNVFIYCLIIFSVHCASTSEQRAGEKVTPEQLIRQYQKREAVNLGLKNIPGFSDIKVPAYEEPVSKKIDENSDYFSISIGSQSPVECSLFRGNQSPTYILRNLYEKVKGNSGLSKMGLKKVFIGVQDRLPFVSMELEYLTNDKLYGNIKSFSLSSIGFVLMCYHDELGYEKTFQTLMAAFAGSKRIQGYLQNIKKYNKRNIQEITYNDQVIGYTENFVFPTDNKELNYYSISNYLIPRDKEMMAGELIEDIYSGLDTGFITKGKYYSYKNDSKEYEINLNEASSGTYNVNGKFRNENINLQFHPDQKIVSLDFILDQLVSGKVTEKNKVIKLYQYHASYPDQLPLSELKIKSLKTNEGKFTFVSGPVSMDFDVDHDGISLVTVVNNNASMVTRRIFSE